MDSEHISRERNVTLRDGLWRLGRARGTVAARVAVKAHPDFREVAADGRSARGRGRLAWARVRDLRINPF